MSNTLIIKKLYILETKFVTRKTIKEYCKELKCNYYDTISYLTRNKYLIRLFKGIFYVPSISERKLNKYDIKDFDLLFEALKLKGVKNWYYGLDSAIKLNNLTHEFYNITYIINDKISRYKPIKILGYNIKFIKIKTKLTRFGLIKKNKLIYSDIEKTILDKIYLMKYEKYSDSNILEDISEYLNLCSKTKLKKYALYYNNTVISFIKSIK